MDQPNDILLSVENLQVHFIGDGPVARAVDGVDFKVHHQETVCLVGESGCGKTVTALAILGLLKQPPASIAGGRITFDGQSLLDMHQDELRALRGKRIAMVFQEPMTSLNPVFTVGDQIGETVLVHERVSTAEVRRRTIQLLDDVGIVDPQGRLGDYPHQLSGGQRQRVMIAMALACEPDLIIADEPTTALDVTVQAQILSLLKKLKQEKNMAIQYITHDLGVVAAIADRVYVMYAGVVVEQGTTGIIFGNARHPYTMALLDSLPTKKKRGQRLYSIPGSVPHPAYRPTGCPFHPRCKFREPSCEKAFPALCDYGKGHKARCPILFATQDRAEEAHA
ncbi:ABC transporter ATP-binding protein [Desulfosarcina sp.]|uniref:ABC transporter ATP-binding protein n=1 Tax=Desulfosarcina sp. TaxID=2027861 RepID=UPI0029A1B1E1|nr:ABC transporter ATP-binding protein [Desulfosarcina sp.]MDX2455546.1 ABC transporter ATP-binding protein [Desulfosarcina sp.]MDX2493035.1 ABC transporter ATP-binding protein [Desulfosarcina sp.]